MFKTGKRFYLSIIVASTIFFTGSLVISLLPQPAHAQDQSVSCDDSPFGSERNCNLAERIADPSGYVYTSWRVLRGTVNIVLIIALLAISFSNILRLNIDNYTIKKALPNLLIGVVLANASLFIIRYLADLSTVATMFFVEQAGYDSLRDFLAYTISLIGIETVLTIGAAAGTLSTILGILLLLITLVGILWLATLLYLRLVVIYLLTILSPLAFIAYGVPGMSDYFKQWWKLFTKWLFILPAMCAIFWLMIVIGSNAEQTGISANASIARTIALYFLFYQALLIPTKFGGGIASAVSAGFAKYSGVNAAREGARKWAGDTAKLAGESAMTKLPGLRSIARYQEWSKKNKENWEKSNKLARERIAQKAASGKGRFSAGRKAGRLTLIEDELKESALNITADNIKAAAEADPRLLDRLKIAELQKVSSEKRLEELKKLHSLDFLKKAQIDKGKLDGMTEQELKEAGIKDKKFVHEIRGILEEFADATADEEIISGEVGREEGIIKGNTMNRLFQMPQVLTNYKDYVNNIRLNNEKLSKATTQAERDEIREKIERDTIAMESVKESYKNLRQKEGYNQIGDVDLRSVDIDNAAQLVGLKDANGNKNFANQHAEAARLATGQQRQALKAFNAGVQGQIKDEIKETTVPQLERELTDYLETEIREYAKDASGAYSEALHNELKQAYFSGDTAKLSRLGLKDHEVRNGIVIAEKFKTIQKSVNDVRFQEGMTTWMKKANDAYQPAGVELFTQEDMTNAVAKNSNDRKQAAGKTTSTGIMGQGPAARQQKGAGLFGSQTGGAGGAGQGGPAPGQPGGFAPPAGGQGGINWGGQPQPTVGSSPTDGTAIPQASDEEDEGEVEEEPEEEQEEENS